MDQLRFDLDVVQQRSLRPAVQLMLADLDQRGRLSAEVAPIVSLFLKLGDALDAAGGRGASVAMLSAQFQEVWDRLVALTALADDEDDAEDFDVVLLPPVEPDDEPPAALPDAS